MNCDLQSSAGEYLNLKPAGAVEAVFAYDHAAAGGMALKLCENLIRQDGGRRTLHSCLWNFDVIHDPEMRRMAARDAAKADIVFIATRKSCKLPRPVICWVEAWVAEKRPGGNCTLITMLGTALDSEKDVSASYFYLESAAQRAGMELHWQSGLPTAVDTLY